MEQLAQASNGIEQPHALSVAVNNAPTSNKPFIEANTVESTLEEIQKRHIIPTYRDSEALISQAEFIEVTEEVVQEVFAAERILRPSVRLSHPITECRRQGTSLPVS